MSKPISIIMTVYDQAPELKENLPAFLTQDYAPGYEVIVVDESSTDETEDVLKLFKNTHPRLYTTFLPRPNRLTSRRRMALSIGVKAAKNDWIILTDIHACPTATDTLQAIADTLDDNTELVLGYIHGKETRLQPFAHIEDASKHLTKTERQAGNGHYLRRMRYMRGDYDFIFMPRERAHDALSLFEAHLSRGSRIGLVFSIFWRNLIRRSSCTVLSSE